MSGCHAKSSRSRRLQSKPMLGYSRATVLLAPNDVVFAHHNNSLLCLQWFYQNSWNSLNFKNWEISISIFSLKNVPKRPWYDCGEFNILGLGFVLVLLSSVSLVDRTVYLPVAFSFLKTLYCQSLEENDDLCFSRIDLLGLHLLKSSTALSSGHSWTLAWTACSSYLVA